MIRSQLVLEIATLTILIVYGSTGWATISNEGLLAEYTYETSGGIPVTGGMSAAGQIDDSGLNPAGPNHAIGSGLVGGEIGLHYDANTPETIDSSFSLIFPSPENPNNYVSIPMSIGDDLSSITLDDFRVETWFQTTDTARSNLVSSYVGPATALNLELHTGNRGRIYVQGLDGTTDLNVTLPTDSRDGSWHHLAGVRSGDTVELYYDGDIVGSMPDVAGSYTVDKPAFYLGMDGRPSGTPRFQGGLDETRLYNSADTSSLVAEYRFETIEGVIVIDGQSAADQVDDTANVGPFHGEGSAATSLSTPLYVADVPNVLISSSYALAIDEQGSSVESATVTVTPELAEITLADFAMETWFKTTDTGRSIPLGGYTGAVTTANLELHTDNRVRIYIDNRDDGITDLNVMAPLGIETRDGQWHHLLGQRQDDIVELYLDGEFVDSIDDLSGSYTMTASEMYIGRDSRTGGTQFDGLLDNTRIWTRALSEDEIEELAAGEVPLTNEPQLQAGDADMDWDFDQLDLVQVQIAAKYLTGQAATWGDGDWNAAPGGTAGAPPTGDGVFDQLDIIAALSNGLYLQGPYAGVSAADLTAAPVPEPSTILLLAFGLLTGLGRCHRCRKLAQT